MAIVLAPLALWFFFAFLLTSRDYVRSRSVPLLVLGAVVQSVICAMMFAFGLVLVGQIKNADPAVPLEPAVLVSLLLAVCIAIPLALISCLPLANSIRASDESLGPQATDHRQHFFLVGFASCLGCACLAVLTFFLLTA